MPVALSRFVRVMSGGNIVTDELVDVRETKVNDALGAVKTELDRLGPATLPALQQRYDGLVASRDAALALGSNKEATEALETVKADARDVARDATAQVDAALAKVVQRDDFVGQADAELATLRSAEAALTAPALKAKATADLVALGHRRDALAGEADTTALPAKLAAAPALIADTIQARKAAQALHKDDAALAKARLDAAAALATAKQSEAQTATPAYKAPVTALLQPLGVRVAALANAADAGAIATQLGLAPTLIADLKLAEAAALKAKQDSDRYVLRTTKLDTEIDATGKWVAVLKPPEDAQPKLDLAALKLARTALDTKPVAELPTALTALETQQATLLRLAQGAAAQQTGKNADAWVLAAVGWQARMNKLTATNPLAAQVNTLKQDKAAAELLADAGARRNALSAVITKAAALQTAVEDVEKSRKAIERVGMTVEQLLTMKPPPTPLPTALIQQRTDTLAKVPGAINKPTMQAAVAALGLVLAEMNGVKDGAEAWRAEKIGAASQMPGVIASITQARAAAGALPAGDPRVALLAEVDALEVRRAAVGTQTTPEAAKTLFALGKEAVALLERARKAQLTDQLAKPDGKAKIDDMIKAIGDKATTPQQEALCRAALAVRFNLELDFLEGLPIERLPQLYAMFAMVPPEHVGHDKLKKLEYNTDASLSASYHQGDRMVLWMPGAERDAPYKPQDGVAPLENLNYFKATTLHEIGHAVDAKQGIMSDGRMGGAEFGGWQKETLQTVAEACYLNAFASMKATPGPTEADLRTLVSTLLETGACAKPANGDPGTAMSSLFATWTQIAASTGFKTCKDIRNPANSPWDKPVPLGTRAYHEGYDGTWFSYLVASRSKGVSNYQWRAPPEWFAELYAYHHMTKNEDRIPSSVKGYIMGTATATS